MALVTATAACMAVLFVLFRAFERWGVDLLPAIVVNYLTATGCGLLVSRPWQAGGLGPLWLPSMVLGVLFVTVFLLTGIGAQRAGVAATAVASKMSLVPVVVAAVWLYGDRPGLRGWLGVVLAVAGVVLASWVRNRSAVRGAWLLPTLLFAGNAVIDIGINWVQRTRLHAGTEAVFPTLVFAFAGCAGLLWSTFRATGTAFRTARTWIAGAVLGLANYAALFFMVRTLARSGLPSSSVYPLVNVGTILIGTAAAMLLFRERPRAVQYVGIALAVAALLLLTGIGP